MNKNFKLDIPYYALSALFFIIVLYQNFIFSSFEMLSFRGVDDLAFHSSIFAYHKNMENFKFFEMNDYGYGWIFWFPISVITYPFYILFESSGIDMPLIVIPRLISLFFAVGSLIVLKRIMEVYTKDRFITFTALVMFLSVPMLYFIAMRFGTGAQIMFFSMLAFYYAVRNIKFNKDDFLKSIIFLAVAGGTKLTGLFILPAVSLIFLHKLKWDIKGNFKLLLKYSLIFLGLLIFFTNPTLFISPFAFKYAEKYYDTVSYFYNATNVQSGDYSFLLNLKAFAELSYGIVNIAFLSVFLLINIFFFSRKKEKSKNFHFLFLLINIFLAVLYLGLKIKHGAVYVGLYSTSFAFILLVSLKLLNQFGKKVKYFGGGFLIYFSIVQIFAFSGSADSGLLYYYNVEKSSKPSLQTATELSELIKKGKGKEKIVILKDHTLPLTLHERKSAMCITDIYDNARNELNNCPEEINFIIFDKKRDGFKSDVEFNEQVKNIDAGVKNTRIEDRKTRQKLILEGTFNSKKYKIQNENEKYILFKRI